MITPKVLKNPQDAIEATEEIRRRFYDLEPLQEKLGRDRLTIDPVEKQPATRQPLEDRQINYTGNDNAYFVELASTTTAVDAWGLWDQVQVDHAEGCSGLTPLVVARSSGATKICSLRVGPLDRSSEPVRAEEICSLLRDEKLDCRMIDA